MAVPLRQDSVPGQKVAELWNRTRRPGNGPKVLDVRSRP
jgi:hypothetical protein